MDNSGEPPPPVKSEGGKKLLNFRKAKKKSVRSSKDKDGKQPDKDGAPPIVPDPDEGDINPVKAAEQGPEVSPQPEVTKPVADATKPKPLKFRKLVKKSIRVSKDKEQTNVPNPDKDKEQAVDKPSKPLKWRKGSARKSPPVADVSKADKEESPKQGDAILPSEQADVPDTVPGSKDDSNPDKDGSQPVTGTDKPPKPLKSKKGQAKKSIRVSKDKEPNPDKAMEQGSKPVAAAKKPSKPLKWRKGSARKSPPVPEDASKADKPGDEEQSPKESKPDEILPSEPPVPEVLGPEVSPASAPPIKGLAWKKAAAKAVPPSKEPGPAAPPNVEISEKDPSPVPGESKEPEGEPKVTAKPVKLKKPGKVTPVPVEEIAAEPPTLEGDQKTIPAPTKRIFKRSKKTGAESGDTAPVSQEDKNDKVEQVPKPDVPEDKVNPSKTKTPVKKSPVPKKPKPNTSAPDHKVPEEPPALSGQDDHLLKVSQSEGALSARTVSGSSAKAWKKLKSNVDQQEDDKAGQKEGHHPPPKEVKPKIETNSAPPKVKNWKKVKKALPTVHKEAVPLIQKDPELKSRGAELWAKLRKAVLKGEFRQKEDKTLTDVPKVVADNTDPTKHPGSSLRKSKKRVTLLAEDNEPLIQDKAKRASLPKIGSRFKDLIKAMKSMETLKVEQKWPRPAAAGFQTLLAAKKKDAKVADDEDSEEEDKEHSTFDDLVMYNDEGVPFIDANKLIYSPQNKHKKQSREKLSWYLPDYIFIACNLLSLVSLAHTLALGIQCMFWDSSIASVTRTEAENGNGNGTILRFQTTSIPSKEPTPGQLGTFLTVLAIIHGLNFVGGVIACTSAYRVMLKMHAFVDIFILVCLLITGIIVMIYGVCDIPDMLGFQEGFEYLVRSFAEPRKYGAEGEEQFYATTLLDEVQVSMQCCGASNWTDYLSTRVTRLESEFLSGRIMDPLKSQRVFPFSCCKAWWVRNIHCASGIHAAIYPNSSAYEVKRFRERIYEVGCGSRVWLACKRLLFGLGTPLLWMCGLTGLCLILECYSIRLQLKNLSRAIKEHQSVKLKRRGAFEDSSDSEDGSGVKKEKKSADSGATAGSGASEAAKDPKSQRIKAINDLKTRLAPPTEDEIQYIKGRTNFAQFELRMKHTNIGRLLAEAREAMVPKDPRKSGAEAGHYPVNLRPEVSPTPSETVREEKALRAELEHQHRGRHSLDVKAPGGLLKRGQGSMTSLLGMGGEPIFKYPEAERRHSDEAHHRPGHPKEAVLDKTHLGHKSTTSLHHKNALNVPKGARTSLDLALDQADPSLKKGIKKTRKTRSSMAGRKSLLSGGILSHHPSVDVAVAPEVQPLPEAKAVKEARAAVSAVNKARKKKANRVAKAKEDAEKEESRQPEEVGTEEEPGMEEEAPERGEELEGLPEEGAKDVDKEDGQGKDEYYVVDETAPRSQPPGRYSTKPGSKWKSSPNTRLHPSGDGEKPEKKLTPVVIPHSQFVPGERSHETSHKLQEILQHTKDPHRAPKTINDEAVGSKMGAVVKQVQKQLLTKGQGQDDTTPPPKKKPLRVKVKKQRVSEGVRLFSSSPNPSVTPEMKEEAILPPKRKPVAKVEATGDTTSITSAESGASEAGGDESKIRTRKAKSAPPPDPKKKKGVLVPKSNVVQVKQAKHDSPWKD